MPLSEKLNGTIFWIEGFFFLPFFIFFCHGEFEMFLNLQIYFSLPKYKLLIILVFTLLQL